MRNILIINNGIIVDIIQQDAEWDSTTYDKQPFDSACEDPSGRFLIGEEYTLEKLLEYNQQSSALVPSELSTNVSPNQAATEITRSDTGEIVKLTMRI